MMWSRGPFLCGPSHMNGRTHNYVLIKEMWQQVVWRFQACLLRSMGLRDKEKYMSPIWILSLLHWRTVAKTFLHPLCVSDKCLTPYCKRSPETNCPNLSGPTQSLAHLRKLPNKSIKWSLSISKTDVSSLHVKDMSQHQHETFSGFPHRCRWVPTWVG